MTALTLDLSPIVKLTDEQFQLLAIANRNLRLELTAKGELTMMPPTGGETGNKNADLLGQIWFWNKQNNLGKIFDSSTGFKLPNGATRSPDVAWITNRRWEALTVEQRKKFLLLCPDFAIELISETDDEEDTEAKMQEYIDNGLLLGWLINPKTKTVKIYRLDRIVETLASPLELSGENVLLGLRVDLQTIWND